MPSRIPLYPPLYVAILLIAISACGWWGCIRPLDRFYTGTDALLRFSRDTVRFDTVFTSRGSSTRVLKIYNTRSQSLLIKRIHLSGGSASPFRLNIDGTAAPLDTDIALAPNDSMYLFVQVTIDPNGLSTPLLVRDSIGFEVNGNRQWVQLTAYGQDAYYLGQSGYDSFFPPNSNITFATDKPYVLMGWIWLTDNSTLTIPAGCKIYMLGGPGSGGRDLAALFIGPNSTLRVLGTADQPVEFASHRLEPEYIDYPFQWTGIYLTPRSRDNEIHHARLRNAAYGIIVDSLSTNANPKLHLTHTLIYNVATAGIAAINGSIKADNCIVANSNGHNVLLLRGGQYEFNHCTLVNFADAGFFYSYIRRGDAPVLAMRNFQVVRTYDGTRDSLTEAPGSARFRNCIIFGSKSEEVSMRQGINTTAPLFYTFEHCLLRVDTARAGQIECILNQMPLFADRRRFDFRLDTIISPGVDAAPDIGLYVDFGGAARPNGTAFDMGAYEFYE